ncbi:MAG: sensor histidine kinase, partial [Clostridiales bacterium]|nr:sensor histidine kinase [Clostridiales bacterium]
QADSVLYSTIRLRLYVPVGTYGLIMWNAGSATNIYLNGQLVENVGIPASDAARSVPGTRLIYYTADTRDGVIEILQQTSNYTGQSIYNYADIVIGMPEAVREMYTKQNTIPAIVMGCFLALCLTHLVLCSMRHFSRKNLLFAIFCLVWFIRTGFVHPWILSSLLPLSRYTISRLYYLTHPLGMLLVCIALETLLPGVIQKWFLRVMTAICAAFACVYVFIDAAYMPEVLPYIYAFIAFALIYLIIRLCVKLRKPDIEQLALLAGTGVFLFGALYDIIFYNVIPAVSPAAPAIGNVSGRTMIEYALLVFLFFQMAVMFRATIREIAAAKEKEHLSRLEAETERRLSTAKSEFLGELSHELRMPISAIFGIAQLLQDMLDDEQPAIADLRDSARWVESEAERMDRLVSQLLDMTAIEAGHLTLKKERIPVEELFDRIQKIYFPMWGGARNRLIASLDRDIYVYADRERVQQILVNLVSNACKYTEDGDITLVAENENGMVRFSVADTGAGMAPDTLTTLFTRYPEMRGAVKGNGLGLYISRKIVEAHGGEIGAASEPGKGTRIWFTIPEEGESTEGDNEE